MPRHVFDPSQPYGQVCGGAARLWEQNGVHFDTHHRPVELDAEGNVRLLSPEEVTGDPVPAAAADDYRSMSVERLKQLCTVYGIEYQSKQQAISELEGGH